MAFSTPKITDHELNTSASCRKTALKPSSHSELEDPTYSLSGLNAALVNIVHISRKSPTSITASVDDKQNHMEFKPWDVWENSLKFHLSSLNDILDISTMAITEEKAQVSDINTNQLPKREQQPTAVARMSPKPGTSSSRITQSSTDNDQLTKREKSGKYCKFCRTNNETAEIYLSHTLYEPKSRTLKCPVLRKLICPTCGATGDQAHTLSYCPVRKANAYGEQQSLFTKIKKSCRLASGKIRI